MSIKYHGGGDENSPLVAGEYEEIRQTLEYERTVQSVEWKALYGNPRKQMENRSLLDLGWNINSLLYCLLCFADTSLVFSQLSRMNTVSYYLGTVLTTAGVTNTNTQLGIDIGLSVWSLFCAAVAAYGLMR
jgi:hypothetical protein